MNTHKDTFLEISDMLAKVGFPGLFIFPDDDGVILHLPTGMQRAFHVDVDLSKVSEEEVYRQILMTLVFIGCVNMRKAPEIVT